MAEFRHRDRASTDDSEYSYNRKVVIDGVTTTDNTTTGVYYPRMKTENMDDYVTPGYEKKSGKGYVINNPCNKTTWELWDYGIKLKRAIAYSQKLYDYQLQDYRWAPCSNVLKGTMPAASNWKTNSSNFIYIEPLDFAHLPDRVVTSARAKINVSEAAVLATLGESKKTIVSLALILKRLIRTYRVLHTLNVTKSKIDRIKRLKHAIRQLSIKDLSNRYMELRYELRPLLYEIRDFKSAVNALKKKHDRQTFRHTESLNAEDISFQTHDFSDTYGGNVVYWQDVVTSLVKRKVQVSAGFLTELEDIDPAQIFGADDLLESAWELVPFSFVVDWFLNAGEKIAAWTPEKGTMILASWLTVKQTIDQSTSIAGSITSTYAANPYSRIDSATYSVTGGIQEKTIGYVRTPSPSMNILPRFKVRLNAFKLTDLGIILTNLVRSFRKS